MNIKEAIEIVTNMLQIRPTGYPVLDIEREALQTLIDNVEANPAPQIDVGKIGKALGGLWSVLRNNFAEAYCYQDKKTPNLEKIAKAIIKKLEAK